MKAIQISRPGGADVLELVDLPTPTPKAGEVLVRARAIGVNYFDLMIRTGKYRWMPKLPFVLGNEMSGQIAEVGAGVRKLHDGQKVFLAGYDIGNRGGLYAEYAVAPAEAVWPLPETVDFDDAVALTNYQLAWLLMHRAARGVEAKTVVVLGAAGGVGTALIDVARIAGADAIGVAGGAAKCAFVKERGAIAAIDHGTENIAERVRALTGGRGADRAFDAAGAHGTLEAAVDATRPGGSVVAIGLADVKMTATFPTRALLRQRWVTGTFGGSIAPRRDIPAFGDLYLAGRLDLEALLDATYRLDELPRAFDDLAHSRVTRGAIRF